MINVLHSIWRAFKMDNAMREVSDGQQCVACDSPNTTLVGPAAYRCQDCGYEGGDGWAALARQKREAGFAQMSPEQRRESAKRDLIEARTLLLSGVGELERAASLSRMDMVGLSPYAHAEVAGEGHEKHAAMTSGVGLLLEAKQLAQDAQAKLGISLGAAAKTCGGGTTNTAAVLDLHLDNLFTDWAVHNDIQRTIVEGQQMQAAVDAVLETLLDS